MTPTLTTERVLRFREAGWLYGIVGGLPLAGMVLGEFMVGGGLPEHLGLAAIFLLPEVVLFEFLFASRCRIEPGRVTFRFLLRSVALEPHTLALMRFDDKYAPRIMLRRRWSFLFSVTPFSWTDPEALAGALQRLADAAPDDAVPHRALLRRALAEA